MPIILLPQLNLGNFKKSHYDTSSQRTKKIHTTYMLLGNCNLSVIYNMRMSRAWSVQTLGGRVKET